MKKIAAGLLGVIALSIVGHAIFPTEVRAQTVEQASAKLARTENQLAKEVSKSATGAAAVTAELQPGQQGLPQQLQEFGRTNDRLKQLQEELSKDIGSFEEARAAKLATLDTELQAIKDTTTRRQMERLRTRALHQVTERLATARATLDTLQLVLAQGEDLTHAAKVVQLAEDLTVQSQDLAAQVQRAKDQASAYAKLTTTLLASLTSTENAE
jgi:23S rRNA maturation mini-RNase III